ncbi:MAG: SusE domain-containing protein [Flavobacterium sp.]|jgi:hypothetical protein
MKNILKTISCIFGFLVFVSCETDRDPVPSANGFELRATTLVPTINLSPAIDNDVIADLNWDLSDNGFNSISSYKVEISVSGTNFANVATANSGNDIEITPEIRNYKLKAGELNALINKLPEFKSQCGQEMNIDIRIKSILGGKKPNAFVQYSSNTISIVALAYSTKPRLLAFASSSSNLESAAKLASSSFSNFNDYEGYLYLEPGTYKFYKPNSCNDFSLPTIYGTNGGTSGAIVLNGADGFIVSSAGHYYIKANLSETGAGALSFSASAFNSGINGFGIYGKATRATGFANTTPMTYDPVMKKWSVTIDLINGQKFSFKTSSTAPVATLVGSGIATFSESPITTFSGTGLAASEGTIKAPGDFVNNNTKTRYNVVVNVSNPRNYTYNLIPNPN